MNGKHEGGSGLPLTPAAGLAPATNGGVIERAGKR
jgi:hypothetical protein